VIVHQDTTNSLLPKKNFSLNLCVGAHSFSFVWPEIALRRGFGLTPAVRLNRCFIVTVVEALWLLKIPLPLNSHDPSRLALIIPCRLLLACEGSKHAMRTLGFLCSAQKSHTWRASLSGTIERLCCDISQPGNRMARR